MKSITRKVIVAALVVSVLFVSAPQAKAQTAEHDAIRAQLQAIMAQLVQLIAQLQAQLAAQIATQSETIAVQGAAIQEQTRTQSQQLERIERNTAPAPEPTLAPIVRTINLALTAVAETPSRSIGVVSVGQEIFVIVEVLENNADGEEVAVQSAPFTITADGEAIRPDLKWATNTTGQKGRATWFKDVPYTPQSAGTHRIEVSSGDATASINVVVE